MVRLHTTVDAMQRGGFDSASATDFCAETDLHGWLVDHMKGTLSILALLLGIFSPAVADDLFSVSITVDGEMNRFGFSNVENVFDQIHEDELMEAFPDYTESSMASATIDFRGLEMRADFVGATSRLMFEVRSLGISETFSGADRDTSLEMLEEFLRDEGGDILNQIQRMLIATSPVDPIAGNPSSLMGTMVSGQFRAGFQDQTTNIDSAAAPATEEVRDPDKLDNLFVLGARFGRFTAAEKVSNVVTLPLGYSFRLKESGTGLRTVDISLPLTYADIEGGTSGAASLGIGLTYAMNERWTLSPAAGAGVVGSVDLGSAGGIGSISLTSAYTIPRPGWSLNIGNMVGYYETLDISLGGYDFNPGVSNTVLRNAMMASVPSTIGDRKVTTEVWAIDTRFFGSDLYSEYYDEIGISFGLTKAKERSIENHLRAGVSYLTGDGVEGWRANLGYSF